MSGLRAYKERQELDKYGGKQQSDPLEDPLEQDSDDDHDIEDLLTDPLGSLRKRRKEDDEIDQLISNPLGTLKQGGGPDEDGKDDGDQRIAKHVEDVEHGQREPPDKDHEPQEDEDDDEDDSDIDNLLDNPLGQLQGGGGDDDDSKIQQEVEKIPTVTYKDRTKEELDDVYLRRTFRKNKTFATARDELAGLRAADNIVQTTEKQRKMAVRTTATLDDHHAKIDKYFSWVIGGAEAAEIDPEKKEHAAEARVRAEHLDKWRNEVHGWAERAHMLSMELNLYEHVVKERRARMKGEKKAERGFIGEIEQSNRFKSSVLELFDRRKQAKEYRLRGKESKQWVSENIGAMGLVPWLGKHAKGTGGGKMLELMTGGILGGEVQEKEGGRDYEAKIKFGAFRKDFVAWREKAEAIKASGAIGKAQGLYLFLSQVAEVWLPQVRRLSTAVAGWTTLLAFMVPAAAPVAAVAATISLVVTGLIGLIQLALLIWTLVRERQTKDRNSRAHRLMQSEAIKHGKGVVESGVSVASSGMLATSHTGNLLAPQHAVEKRFLDPTNTSKVDYGSIGFAHHWHLGPVDMSSLDDEGVMGGMVGQGFTEGNEMLAYQLGSSKVRDKRIVDQQIRNTKYQSQLDEKRKKEISDTTPSFLKKRRKREEPSGPSDLAVVSDPKVQDKTAQYGKQGKQLASKFDDLAKKSVGVSEKADSKSKKKKGPSNVSKASTLVDLAKDLDVALDDDVVED